MQDMCLLCPGAKIAQKIALKKLQQYSKEINEYIMGY